MKKKNDAEIKYKIGAETKDINTQMDNLKAKGANLGKNIFKGIAAGVTVASTALAGLVAKSVSSYAELEQNIGGVETLFKDSSQKVIDNANKAFKTAGVSANEYMQGVTSFSASLLQSVANDTEKAADIADMAFRDMSDNANKFGTDMGAIQSAYQGFAKQNYTMLDNLKLGYGGTKTEMERLLKDAQKISGVKYDIDNLSDVYNAIHIIQEELGVTGTTAEEASSTISGSVTSMKAAFDNFLNGSGSIQNVIDSIINVMNNLSGAIVELAPNIVQGIVELLNNLIPQLPGLLQVLLPVIIDGAVSLMQGLANSLPVLIPVLMDGIVQAFLGIVDILPEILQTLLQAAIYIIQALAEQMPVLIPAIIDAILEMIPILVDNAPLFIKAGAQLLIGILTGIIQSVPRLLSYIPQIISSIINYFGQLPSLLFNIGHNLIAGLWNGIANVKDWILNKIKGFGNSVIKSIKGIFGIHSPSKVMFEIGGYFDKGFIEGVEDMKKDVIDSVDDTFGSGLDYLYNGFDNVSLGVGNMSYAGLPNQTIYLNNQNDNHSVLEVDGKVLTEIVNSHNSEREVAV